MAGPVGFFIVSLLRDKGMLLILSKWKERELFRWSGIIIVKTVEKKKSYIKAELCSCFHIQIYKFGTRKHELISEIIEIIGSFM